MFGYARGPKIYLPGGWRLAGQPKAVSYPEQTMTSSIRLDAIPKTPEDRRKQFGPFTSTITAASLFGICIAMFSIVYDKF